MVDILTLQVKDSQGNVIGTATITDADADKLLEYYINSKIDTIYQKVIEELKHDEDTLTWLRGKLLTPCVRTTPGTPTLLGNQFSQLFGTLFQVQLLNAITSSLQPRDFTEFLGALLPIVILVPLVKALI